MKTETVFDTGLQAYSVRPLSLQDIEAIQELFEKCLDYMLLVDGHAADPNAIEEDVFQFTPPGKSLDDKFVFGILNQQNDLVGLLEGLRQYPDETTWWIGLLLFVPEARSQGLGQVVVQGFAEYVRANGGQAIMLGVIEDNERAYKFWNRMGFEFVRKTEPRSFGNKTQTVSIMRRTLLAETGIQIRKATVDDIASLVELNLGLFQEDAGQRDPYMNLNWPNEGGHEHFSKLVSGDDSICLLATTEGAVIGYLAGYLWDGGTLRPLKMAELESMYIRQNWRSRGGGRQLAGEFLKWAKQKGAQRAAVTAYVANTRAIEFYKELGFEPRSLSLELGVK